MCTEPETMTPIIMNRNIQQVTLLGDSLGLKPHVNSKTACLLGLQKSLMEAYVDITIDLRLQYRMVCYVHVPLNIILLVYVVLLHNMNSVYLVISLSWKDAMR